MSIKSSVSRSITDRAGRRHPAPEQHGPLLTPSSDRSAPRCGWRCCTAGCPSVPMIRYILLKIGRHHNEMFNINITEKVLTKCQDLVVQHSSSESTSSRGQFSRQSPPLGIQLQYFCCVQPSPASIVNGSSSNQEDLQDNYPFYLLIFNINLTLSPSSVSYDPQACQNRAILS